MPVRTPHFPDLLFGPAERLRAWEAALMGLLANRGGDWSVFSTPRATLRITVNKQEADVNTPLAASDEVAFIESVSL